MKRSDKSFTDDRSELTDGAATRRLGGASVCTLTAAEKKILACVSLAKTNKEIAGELHISPATVKRHVENILRKLGLRNRVEAALYGLLTAGCSRETNPGCGLRKWWCERADAVRSTDSWAI